MLLPSSVQAVIDETSIIKLDLEKGWLASADFMYSSRVTELLRNRNLQAGFVFGHVFNRTFSLLCAIDSGFVYTYYPNIQGQQEERTETLSWVGNLALIPQYTFDWRGSKVQILTGIWLPTYQKISGSVTYEEDAKEKRFFAIEPGVILININDPIISTLGISLFQPLGKNELQKDVYNLWKAGLSAGVFFVANERFSYFTNLNLLFEEKKETYNLVTGVAYYPKTQVEWRIYLSNDYDGVNWSSKAGITLGLFKKTT